MRNRRQRNIYAAACVINKATKFIDRDFVAFLLTKELVCANLIYDQNIKMVTRKECSIMPDRVFTEEQREELRIIMLEAGFPLIKEYGVTHTTISRITEAAGIAKGTFYHFWKNKEEYLADLIQYHRQKMLPVLIGADVLAGKRKLGREDARVYFRHLVDKEKSIYAHMTLEDESNLIHKTSDFDPDEEKESSIAINLLSFLEGVRSDVDLLLVANMTKILVLTAEAKEELHESVYEKTIDTIIDGILNLIFEEGR